MEKLDIQHDLSRYLFQDAAILLLILDQAGRIMDANNYTRRLTGDDLIGKTLADVVLDFTGTANLTSLLQKKETLQLLNVRTRSGLPQTFYFHFIESGENILAFGEINSLEIETLRKNLLSANNDLSNLSRELQKTNAELTKLNELKNQFLGMAAHDLRNPIGVILTYSDFLLEEAEGVLKEEHTQFLAIIRRSSEFMLSLLNDLLDIAKIESGRLDLELEPADLAALIRNNVLLNQSLADKKAIRIIFRDEAPLLAVLMDSMKIEQVLNNLITNAVKFSPPGTTVEVNISKSADQLTLSVRDEGQGIPEDERKKLFQPFSRTSVKSTGGEKSTGLGLAIVRKIVLGHGGKIGVDSEVGRGSTFYFTLPLKP
ncbi:MAG: ATP-binding protein [Syntrophus sp. (in: bacteria)]